MSSIDMHHTERGFSKAVFKDRYGSECSLQKSSLAGEHAIWFGVDKPFPRCDGWPRMHLTQEQVGELLPILQRFAETGELI
ncbi:hypothetical protein [Bosea massiliensis]|uniref:Uncharacterized protein n=1 Tax=Bosea massiliensis TaxID=151419 RepID=A0ABW0P9H0_9HYPH